MKSINLIENKGKNKKSKIKEAFKKIGEYSLIAATAFTLSCGGVETESQNFPDASPSANLISSLMSLCAVLRGLPLPPSALSPENPGSCFYLLPPRQETARLSRMCDSSLISPSSPVSAVYSF